MLKWVDETKEVIGTHIRVLALADSAQISEKVELAYAECGRIEKKYSRFLSENELDFLNRRCGEWVEVSAEFFELIKFGVEMNLKTEGYFDLSVKGILEKWGYDMEYSFEEKGGEAQTGALIEIKEGNLVRIERPIEIGGLGKGYAIDRMRAELAEIEDFCINAGGDIFCKGLDPEGKPWKILFENPVDISQAIGFVEVNNFAVASSNSAKRNWKNKHHLVDPKNKIPANEMLAVYTQASSAILADSYSTALFVMGLEKAKKMVEHFGVEAMLIGKNSEIFQTKNFKGKLFLE